MSIHESQLARLRAFGYTQAEARFLHLVAVHSGYFTVSQFLDFAHARSSFLSRKLKGGLSWETVHHFKCGLGKILGAAEEWGYIAENAAQKTKLPRRQHGTERTVLTPVQVRNLVTALTHPARSVTLLLVLTGLRVGELLALRWGSVDLNARMLRVCETVYDGHFDQPKTKRSARTIPIGTETAEIFAAIRPAVVAASRCRERRKASIWTKWTQVQAPAQPASARVN